MTLKFKIRVTRRIKEGEHVPVYIRLLDGVACDQTVKTRILVRPEYWDPRAQCIKSRSLCPDSEKRKLTDDILTLRSFVSQMYYEKKSTEGKIPADWLVSIMGKYYKTELVFKYDTESGICSDKQYCSDVGCVFCHDK